MQRGTNLTCLSKLAGVRSTTASPLPYKALAPATRLPSRTRPDTTILLTLLSLQWGALLRFGSILYGGGLGFVTLNTQTQLNCAQRLGWTLCGQGEYKGLPLRVTVVDTDNKHASTAKNYKIKKPPRPLHTGSLQNVQEIWLTNRGTQLMNYNIDCVVVLMIVHE